MLEGSLLIQPDGLLTVNKSPGEDTASLDTALSAFAELASATETRSTYQLTAAALWQARRRGLSLAEILRTLETYSQREIPANVRADMERWSKQIERLTLEADQGRLFLRSNNPLVITAVQGHHTLGAFVTRQVDATTLELRTDTYPEVLQTFDACQYPFLDRVQAGWNTSVPPSAPSQRRGRRSAQRSRRHMQPGGPPAGSHPEVVLPTGADLATRPQVGPYPLELVEALRRHLPRQCQATTRAGRPCKNRARPSSPFCRVHADRTSEPASLDSLTQHADVASYLLDLMLQAGLVTLGQLALVRTGILLGIGLCTWLLYALLMGIGVGWFHLPLAAWYTAGIALLLTCWFLGRSLARLGVLASLHLLFYLLTSLLIDCCYKGSLILNICFFLIPVVLPGALLVGFGLSFWWGFLLFPIGLVIGKLLYTLLDETSG